MNACVNTYEMRMPANYVDMNKEEMEYERGSGINIGSDHLSWTASGVVFMVERVLGCTIPVFGAAMFIADGIDLACKDIWGKGLEELLDHEEPDKRGKYAYRGH